MAIIGFISIAAGILGLGFELYRRSSRTDEQKQTLGNIPHFVLGMSLIIIILGIGLVYIAYNPELLSNENVSGPAPVVQQAAEPNNQEKTSSASSSPAQEDKTPTASEEISITSYQLCTEYRANEALANTKYKDKVLIVSGVINKVGKDYANKLFLSIDGFDAVSSTACFFDPAKVTELNKLRNGQTVTIKGTCSGMAGDVALQDCQIVSSATVN
ncbi:MAG: hypothetical protein ABRQ26_08210 [Syntrophomonadaceae bacterium]